MTVTEPRHDDWDDRVRAAAPVKARPWVRRALSAFSVALLLGGVAMVSYPFATNLYQGRVQGTLQQQLASPELKQAYQSRKVAVGDSLTRIKIPALGVNTVVVEGTTASALRAGAGHYAHTALPCERGNVAIAGHRTTYGKPFADVDRLKPGDTIELTTPIGGCVYRVARAPYIVGKADVSVLEATGGRDLTLTSCHPKGSAEKRIIIRATWVKDLERA